MPNRSGESEKGRRLSLARETVRVLNERQGRSVAGGASVRNVLCFGNAIALSPVVVNVAFSYDCSNDCSGGNDSCAGGCGGSADCCVAGSTDLKSIGH